MANHIIKCINCGNPISDKVSNCPNCGYDMSAKIKKNKNKKKAILISIPLILIGGFIIGITNYIKSNAYKYKTALQLYNNSDYEESIDILNNIKDYKDSQLLIDKCNYELANNCFIQKQYDECMEYIKLVNAVDTTLLVAKTNYMYGLSDMDNNDYLSAYENFTNLEESSLKDLSSYKKGDLDKNISECKEKIIELGLSSYNNLDYVTAYKYWFTCVNDLPKSYQEEFNACCIIKNAQGKRYNKYDNENMLSIDNTTVTISGNDEIEDGVYKTHLGQIDNSYVLFLDDEDTYITLPYTKDCEVKICNNDKNNYFDTNSYYTMSAIKQLENRKDSVVSQEDEKEPPAIGMNASEVKASSWGEPKKIHKTTYAWGTKEQWCYDNHKYIYFKDGIVEAISE